ncbi:hypothetical protein LLG90_24545 [Aromatoleum toluclasticum]|uniref:hypothetical protein n=1 Tax=Aromatoleum toluclasticum TaxID=92003 RepID=UPI001D1946B8|nr:hypothetical protein [Aromatoleum toluclasticum]MCC4118533.1 hypothetical protein [Aromatoleum toluclasticum]
MDAESGLPSEVFDLIRELISRTDVQSVSCCLDDEALWRMLVEEQVRRARRLQVPPQNAFTLSGPDSGLLEFDPEEFGGAIHIPYEGVCDGDLYFPPKWRKFRPEHAGPEGRLSWAFSKKCHFVLTPQDRGELGCATRMVVGNWVLYQSLLPYTPCDPLGHSG